MVDIYRVATRRGIYPPLFNDPEGDSCFIIYQIRWIKRCRFINGHNFFFFWNFRETTRHFSLRSQNSEYPRIFQVTGANQNARKLLFTDLVNTNWTYPTPDRAPDSNDSQNGYQSIGFLWNFFNASLGNLPWLSVNRGCLRAGPCLIAQLFKPGSADCETIDDSWLLPLSLSDLKAISNSSMHFWIALAKSQLTLTSSTFRLSRY